MGFWSQLFSSNKGVEKKANEDLNGSHPQYFDFLEEDEYLRVGLTRTVTEEEKEIVSVIASAIMAGDHPNTKVSVKSVIGIDEGKEAAAVIAAAIAAKDYPHAVFRLVSVEEIKKSVEEIKKNEEVAYA